MIRLTKLPFALCAALSLSPWIHAAPPRVTEIEPAADSEGLWVVHQSGLSRVRIEFDQSVIVPEGAVSVWAVGAGPLTDATVLQDSLSSIQITFAAAIHDDRLTIVVDHSVTNFQGEVLDGQFADPDHPQFPSGNGLPGGHAVFRYNILQGDANRDEVVDSLDVLALQIALGTCAKDLGYSDLADLNDDGCINVLDINILLNGIGGALPPAGRPLQIVSISPNPALPLGEPISEVAIEFTSAIAPNFLLTNSCFLVDDAKQIVAPASAILSASGTVATYTFAPAAPQCGQHHLEISNSIADTFGTLLSGQQLETYSGFTQPPVPTIGRHAILTTKSTITLSGTASYAASVQVAGNGGTTTAPAGSGTFSVNAPLAPNAVNTLYVSGVSACDAPSAPITTQVIMDVEPPTISILFPQDDLEVTDATIDVSGNVGDLLSGQFGLSVVVNGLQANVNPGIGTNGTFELSDLPLSIGQNIISATATDAAGNIAVSDVTVVRQAVPKNLPTLVVVSGDQQSSVVNGELAQPLVVQILQPNGRPVAGKLVNFTVTRSDGVLASQSGSAEGELTLQTFTDSNGLASAYWTLGSDAGSGNNRLTATSTGVAGVVFLTASAVPGPASRIVVSANNNQRAQAGGSLPLPLIARVLDGQNPVSGVPVTFSVLDGGGSLADATLGAFGGASAGTEVVVVTGPDGIAQAGLTLGVAAGINRVQADFDGNTGSPVVFTAQAVQSVYGQPTTFTGLVLDNVYRGIGGAQAMLKVNGKNLPPVTTDVEGRFVMNDVPAGAGMLYVNASMATTLNGKPIQPGSFPALQFSDVVIVPNAENKLPTPVRLPALNPTNQANYSTTQETVLTVEGIDGLQFIIAPGSMTLADGSPAPDGTLMRLNQVHFDQTPMPLPDGVANPFAWTLLPGAATFDPPIRIELPNMTGLPPGSVSYFSSFNHDTGRFEICGTGSVTPDGSMIISDPGSGISISGWGAPQTPPPPTFLTTVDQTILQDSDVFDQIHSDWAKSHPYCNPECLPIGNGSIVSDFHETGGWIIEDKNGNLRIEPVPPGPECETHHCSIDFTNYLPLVDDGDIVLGAYHIHPEPTGVSGNPYWTLSPSYADTDGTVMAQSFLAGSGYNVATNYGEYVITSDKIWFIDSGGTPYVIVDHQDWLFEYDTSVPFNNHSSDLFPESLFHSDAHHVACTQVLDGTPVPPYSDSVLDTRAAATIGGVSTSFDEWGRLELSNIPIIGGLMQVIVTAQREDGTLYAASDFFLPEEGVVIDIEQQLLLSETPPNAIEVIQTPLAAPILKPGEGFQLEVIGTFNDGSQQALPGFNDGTWYETSNADIASVNQDGFVTAVNTGTAFITISNRGVTTTKRIDVLSPNSTTNVVGITQFEDGTPAVGAVVLSEFGGQTISGGGGTFQLEVVYPTGAESIGLTASIGANGITYIGYSIVTPVNPGGLTDAGIITLKQSFGIPTCNPLAWQPTFGPEPGTNDGNFQMIVHDDGSGSGSALLVGGWFTSAGGVAANRVAKWDGSTWSALGSGMNISSYVRLTHCGFR